MHFVSYIGASRSSSVTSSSLSIANSAHHSAQTPLTNDLTHTKLYSVNYTLSLKLKVLNDLPSVWRDCIIGQLSYHLLCEPLPFYYHHCILKRIVSSVRCSLRASAVRDAMWWCDDPVSPVFNCTSVFTFNYTPCAVCVCVCQIKPVVPTVQGALCSAEIM